MTANIDKILERFKFKQPVPQEIQGQILSFKRKTTVNVLKHFGKYNIYYGYVLRFYFFTKRIGINLTARQAEILFSFINAALAVAGIITAAGLIFFNNETFVFKENFSENKITIERPSDLPKETTAKKAVLMNRLGITQILSDVESEEFALILTDKLFTRLKDIKNQDMVIYRKTDSMGRSINRLLTGRLNKVGSTYLLSISITNAETGKILFDKNYSFKETDEADEIIKNAADTISNNKNIW